MLATGNTVYMVIQYIHITFDAVRCQSFQEQVFFLKTSKTSLGVTGHSLARL